MTERPREIAHLHVNDCGTILRKVSAATVQTEWWPVIVDAKEACLQHLGAWVHSVYVFGSVAEGLAKFGASDLDICVVTRRQEDEAMWAWAACESTTIVKRHPFVRAVHYTRCHLDTLTPTSQLSVILKLFGVCIHGEDLVHALADARLGRDTAFACRHIKAKLCLVLLRLETTTSKRQLLLMCRWIAKSIVRAGFELVMIRERRYTREMSLACEAFIRHYPERSEAMLEVLRHAQGPTTNAGTIRRIVADTLSWMPTEIDRVWGPDMHEGLGDAAPDEPDTDWRDPDVARTAILR